MDESSTKKWMNVAVGVLVVLIVAEAGYFLYTRYVGSVKFPWSSSQGAVGNQATASPSIEEQFNAAKGRTPSGDVDTKTPPRQISQAKLSNVLKGYADLPPSMLADAKMSFSLTGTVVGVDNTPLVTDNQTYVTSLQIIGSSSDKLRLRMTQYELDHMVVTLIKSDDTTQTLTYKDISVGDQVLVLTTTDLLDWREGMDSLVVEVRRPKI